MGCSLLLVGFLSRKPLSQMHRSTFSPLQDANPTPSFGGFGLRCPWTVALLLGRTLNALRVHLYEWEDGPDYSGAIASPRYLPSLVVRSGAGGSPIESVILPARL